MANYNKVILVGNLTRDPEVRYTPKGTAVADIGIAINRVSGGGEGGERREETTFVDVTLWGRNAELTQQYLGKGRAVMIEGRLQLDSWDDKQTGQKRSKLKVVGETMQFLGGPQGGGQPRAVQAQPQQAYGQPAAPQQQGGSAAPSYSQVPPQNPAPPAGGSPSPTQSVEFEDDDIPF